MPKERRGELKTKPELFWLGYIWRQVVTSLPTEMLSSRFQIAESEIKAEKAFRLPRMDSLQRWENIRAPILTGCDNSDKTCCGRTTQGVRDLEISSGIGRLWNFLGKHDMFRGHDRQKSGHLVQCFKCLRKNREDIPNFRHGFQFHNFALKQRLLQPSPP